jgi:hypothetical protein
MSYEDDFLEPNKEMPEENWHDCDLEGCEYEEVGGEFSLCSGCKENSEFCMYCGRSECCGQLGSYV